LSPKNDDGLHEVVVLAKWSESCRYVLTATRVVVGLPDMMNFLCQNYTKLLEIKSFMLILKNSLGIVVENFSHQNGFKIFQLIKRYKYLIELKFPTKFINLKINGSFHCTLYRAPWDFYW
jgi:hypothetical protein